MNSLRVDFSFLRLFTMPRSSCVFKPAFHWNASLFLILFIIPFISSQRRSFLHSIRSHLPQSLHFFSGATCPRPRSTPPRFPTLKPSNPHSSNLFRQSGVTFNLSGTRIPFLFRREQPFSSSASSCPSSDRNTGRYNQYIIQPSTPILLIRNTTTTLGRLIP